jgi:hypothetical protein
MGTDADKDADTEKEHRQWQEHRQGRTTDMDMSNFTGYRQIG